MTHTQGRVVLDSADISRALTRLAHEIIERTQGAQNVTLMGIPTRGVALANRLAGRIGEIQGHPIHLQKMNFAVRSGVGFGQQPLL